MMSEENMIEGCKHAQHAACEALYKKYATRLMAISMRYSSTTFEAEDILQESFIKIFHHIHTYTGKGAFEGWLKRIVVNTAVNHYHRNQRKAEQFIISDDSDYDVSSQQDDIIDRMSADDLIKLIQELPEGYRIVFNLYEIEGYSHKEIAELLAISDGTSKSQLSKAKNLLRKLLLKSEYTPYE
jgi:RNA polymerase sigma-70 factor (ECF subfamily)